MCSFSSFDLIWFFILQNFMKFMEMQHAIVVSLIGFFGSWAIVLGQSCLTIESFFQFLAIFWNFWNNGIIYSDCKMHLLLWYSFNRFEIIQRAFVGYREYGLCFSWRTKYFWIFWRIFEFWNIGIIYCNCKMYLLLQFSFNRFEIIQGSSIGYKHYGLCFFGRSK